MERLRNPLILLLATGLAACASAGGSRSARCELRPMDSVHVQGTALYRECAVDVRAELLNPTTPIDFRPSGGRTCYSAMIEFVVDTAGAPELATARVVRSNSDDLARALLAALPQWRYRPARRAGAAVRQLVQLQRAVALVAVRAGSLPSPSSRPPC